MEKRLTRQLLSTKAPHREHPEEMIWGSLNWEHEQYLLYQPAKIGNSFVSCSCPDLYSNCTNALLHSLICISAKLCCVHLYSRSDRLLLLLGRSSRGREHLQVIPAGKRLSNRHTSQHTNRLPKAPPEINTCAELQECLDVTDPQMEAIERALPIRRKTSLDQLCQDCDGSTLMR